MLRWRQFGAIAAPSDAAGGRVAFYNSTGCPSEFVHFELEREVCGWAGCNWKLLDGGGISAFPGASFVVVVSGPCQPGNYQYRAAW